ncbi:MAG: Rieske (2Fe-2S) protein [Maribacter sp.]|nr:Rieske (2Fe-2S) protein [Maribacter sp.]
MERKEFLRSVGAGAAFAITFACLGGCLKEDPNPLTTEDPNANTPPDPVTGVLFTVDLSASTSSKLQNTGGYLTKNNVVVAKDLKGEYVAATVVCSHELRKDIIFNNDEFYCTAHGARFDLTGKGINNDGKRGLRIYATSLEGNILSILA